MIKLPKGKGGFSLVELIVAMVVLTVGLLALAAGTGFVIRTAELGRVDTARATALESAVDELRAFDFDDLTGSGELEDRDPWEVEWEVIDQVQSQQTGQVVSRVVQITLTGPGRGASRAEGEVTTTSTHRINRRAGGS